MSIPESCTVLVVGGGPGGSYAASALAREGADVVVLEADHFPRYHIGETMLASLRHHLRFIDLQKTFDDYGFCHKNGAAFKLNNKKVGFTDFRAANGEQGYSWNVIRSESDKLMLDHSAKSGAHVFEGVKVDSLDFAPEANFSENEKLPNPGRVTSAAWSRKTDSTKGSIKCDYIIDASGRHGLTSTKYLKNRKQNKALKNSAIWGYWKGCKTYAPGTRMEGSPFFEALTDGSGWCWAIPLHNGTMSVGVVIRQDLALAHKAAQGSPSEVDNYKYCVSLATEIHKRLADAEFVSNVKAGADWSYSASAYAGPNFRLVGDAGCFIDPYFSSGVHLASASALSAAMTIQAARRGDCSEYEAAKWHSDKVAESYSRFLLVVIAALRQIRKGDDPVLSDFDEDGFDRAFSFFRPIIQGHADTDVGGKLTQGLVSKSVDFCLHAFEDVTPEAHQAVLDKINSVKIEGGNETAEDLEKLNEDELRVLRTIRARQILSAQEAVNMNGFSQGVMDGLAPQLVRGSLSLRRVDAGALPMDSE
ncbi:Sulochrin halogenase, partial [Lachnellula suecica]